MLLSLLLATSCTCETLRPPERVAEVAAFESGVDALAGMHSLEADVAALEVVLGGDEAESDDPLEQAVRASRGRAVSAASFFMC